MIREVRGHILFRHDAEFSAERMSDRMTHRELLPLLRFGKYTVEGDTLTVVADWATIPAFDGLPRKTGVRVNGDDVTIKAAPVNGPQGTFTPIPTLKRAH